MQDEDYDCEKEGIQEHQPAPSEGRDFDDYYIKIDLPKFNQQP